MSDSLCLDAFICDFFEFLQKTGYSQASIICYKKCADKFAAFAEQRADMPIFSEELVDSYIEYYDRQYPTVTKNDIKRKREMHRFLIMMQDYSLHGAILRHKLKNPDILKSFSNERKKFCEFMSAKGLSNGSKDRITFVIDKYSDFLYQRGIYSFSEMDRNDFTAFLSTQAGFTKKTQSVTMYALRVFTLFLNESQINLTISGRDVPCIRYVERRSLPTAWTEDDCIKLLGAVERNTAMGKRDYAILMLAINLGMRQGDILNLKFHDINWKAATISFVQEKTGTKNTLALDEDTGWAIIDYLKNGRPPSEIYQNIFLRHRPPYVPMSGFYTVLQRYLIRAGIKGKAENTAHGLHSLRHSLAARMLEDEIPLETISSIMGHLDINTSLDYLKVDLKHLRQCALEMEV